MPDTPDRLDRPGLHPGEVLLADEPLPPGPSRRRHDLTVENTGDRPIQVGSHYHFAEANPALAFDREAAWGFRLDVPAGTSVRFEPGVTREVALVAFGGRRVIWGLRGACAGPLDTDGRNDSDDSPTGTGDRSDG